MFTINAYHNPYLRIDQSTHQAVLSIRVDSSLNVAPAPLALAIALDRSGSMDGAKLRAAGDNEKATRLLAHALEISEHTGNEKITRLLSDLVQRDAKGTIRLNPQANAVARKTLAINTGRTSKLK